MNRRNFILGAGAAAGLVSFGGAARAYQTCGYDPRFGQVCEAGVDLTAVYEAYDYQWQNQWCWAASIEMIFNHYGYRVSQPRIVQETYGVVRNVPAVTGYTISQNLNRLWVDDNGRRFRVSIEGLYDYDAGILGLTNDQIINALVLEHPLLYGNWTHAMVLTAIFYAQSFAGPQILNIGLADPWPGNGLRGPMQGEMTAAHLGGAIRYLCLPRVTAA